MHGGERPLQDDKALYLGIAPQGKLENMRIETHSDHNSMVHLQSINGQRLGFYRDAEGKDVDDVLGKRDVPNYENLIVNVQENAKSSYQLYEPGFSNVSLPFVVLFEFVKTEDSSRGPILNALEINKYVQINYGT